MEFVCGCFNESEDMNIIMNMNYNIHLSITCWVPEYILTSPVQFEVFFFFCAYIPIERQILEIFSVWYHYSSNCICYKWINAMNIEDTEKKLLSFFVATDGVALYTGITPGSTGSTCSFPELNSSEGALYNNKFY